MKKRSIFWGMFFILAAMLIIVNSIGIDINISIVKVLITIALIPVIVKSFAHLDFYGALFPIAIIGIMFSKFLGLKAFTPWSILGVALFLSIGLSFIFPKKRSLGYGFGGFGNAEASSETDNFVNIISKYTGTVKYITSSNLKEVNISAKCSGTKVYFDNTMIDGDTLKVNVDARLSGIELYIPSDWRIVNNVDCFIGGVDVQNEISIAKTKTIELNGFIRLSGIMIKYITIS